MSSRRELLRRLGFLNDISGIMSAMKALALMEMRILEEFLAAQHRMVASIEASAARFIAWNPKLFDVPPPDAEICLLIGSEQGFCGDFNEDLLNHWQGHDAVERAGEKMLVVGNRLAGRLGGETSLQSLPGASVADEVPRVLLGLTKELNVLMADALVQGWGVSALYHCHATGEIKRRRLLPLRDLPPAPEAAAFPPDLNLSPEAFLEGLTGHYLYAVLNDILYSSLMAENQRRYAQMESALSKLDEDRNQLRLAYNARRQEDITEEIEILLLAADLFRA